MANKSYLELLRDPRWQRKRLEALQRTDFTCESCESKETTLHVHHKQYKRGAKPWEYEVSELSVLCENCHEIRHRLKSEIEDSTAEMDLDALALVAGYARAVFTRHEPGAVIHVIDAQHATGIGTYYRIGYSGVIELMRGEMLHVDDVVAKLGL